MKKATDRPSIYMNTKLSEVRARGRSAGETLSGELTHMAHRYDAALSMVVPDLAPDQLAVLRRIFVGQPRLPMVFIGPRAVAGLVEDAADSRFDDEATLRLIFAVARRIARMSAIECLALVEATERWVRRPVSQADERLGASVGPSQPIYAPAT